MTTHPTRTTTRRLGAVLLTAGLALGATACSGTSSPSGMPGMTGMTGGAMSTSGPYAAADVAFATQMIPHHQQAVRMAQLALSTSTDAGVRALATSIQQAQDPEIQTMTRWMTTWGATPTPGDSGGMGGMAMPGMMSAADLSALAAATGPAFDRMWLTMMIVHHQGAVTMARTELADGSSAEAKALATAVVDGQSAQISTMESMQKAMTAAG